MMYTQTAEKLSHSQDRQRSIRNYNENSNILLFPVPEQHNSTEKSVLDEQISPDPVKRQKASRLKVSRKRRRNAQMVMACYFIAAIIALTLVFAGVIIFQISLSSGNAAELFSVFMLIQTPIWAILLVRS